MVKDEGCFVVNLTAGEKEVEGWKGAFLGTIGYQTESGPSFLRVCAAGAYGGGC